MRAKDDHREAAIALRIEGRSYNDIQAELGVSKGSLSLWLRDLPNPTRGAVPASPMASHLEAPPDREIARALREDGWLLKEIAEKLGVTVKTAQVWCAGLPVPPRAVHGRSPEEMRAINRATWDARLEKAEQERQVVRAQGAVGVGALSARELELLATAVYWCEGSKSKPWRRDERVQFINSDPDIIRLWVCWLRTRGIEPEDCWLSVSIHESADVEAATLYWADVVGVDPHVFAKAVLKRHNPRTVRKNTGASYVGCLAIYVRGGRRLYQELEGRWQGIACALEAS